MTAGVSRSGSTVMNSARAVRVGSERAENLGDLEQGRGTHVGAMGETEEHQEGVPLQILICDHLTILIGELEGSADGGDLLRDRRGEPPSQDQDDAEAKRQARDKGGGHQKNAAVACGYLGMP
jgi:hypothetical protein